VHSKAQTQTFFIHIFFNIAFLDKNWRRKLSTWISLKRHFLSLLYKFSCHGNLKCFKFMGLKFLFGKLWCNLFIYWWVKNFCLNHSKQNLPKQILICWENQILINKVKQNSREIFLTNILKLKAHTSNKMWSNEFVGYHNLCWNLIS
jgi:hypothetical protein